MRESTLRVNRYVDCACGRGEGNLTTKGTQITKKKEEGTQEMLVPRMALIIAQGKGKPLKRLHLPCDQ